MSGSTLHIKTTKSPTSYNEDKLFNSRLENMKQEYVEVGQDSTPISQTVRTKYNGFSTGESTYIYSLCPFGNMSKGNVQYLSYSGEIKTEILDLHPSEIVQDNEESSAHDRDKRDSSLMARLTNNNESHREPMPARNGDNISMDRLTDSDNKDFIPLINTQVNLSQVNSNFEIEIIKQEDHMDASISDSALKEMLTVHQDKESSTICTLQDAQVNDFAAQNTNLLVSEQNISISMDSVLNGSTSKVNEPNGSTSRDTGPNGSTSMYSEPNGSTSKDTEPNGSTSMYNEPNGSTLRDTGPNGSTSKDTEPNGSTSMNSVPNGRTSMDIWPNGSTSMDTEPNGSTSMDNEPKQKTALDSEHSTEPIGTCLNTEPTEEDCYKHFRLKECYVRLTRIDGIINRQISNLPPSRLNSNFQNKEKSEIQEPDNGNHLSNNIKNGPESRVPVLRNRTIDQVSQIPNQNMSTTKTSKDHETKRVRLTRKQKIKAVSAEMIDQYLSWNADLVCPLCCCVMCTYSAWKKHFDNLNKCTEYFLGESESMSYKGTDTKHMDHLTCPPCNEKFEDFMSWSNHMFNNSPHGDLGSVAFPKGYLDSYRSHRMQGKTQSRAIREESPKTLCNENNNSRNNQNKPTSSGNNARNQACLGYVENVCEEYSNDLRNRECQPSSRGSVSVESSFEDNRNESRSQQSQPSSPGSVSDESSCEDNRNESRSRQSQLSSPGSVSMESSCEDNINESRSQQSQPSSPGSLSVESSCRNDPRHQQSQPSSPGSMSVESSCSNYPRHEQIQPSSPGIVHVSMERFCNNNPRHEQSQPSSPGTVSVESSCSNDPRHQQSQPSSPGSVSVESSCSNDPRHQQSQPSSPGTVSIESVCEEHSYDSRNQKRQPASSGSLENSSEKGFNNSENQHSQPVNITSNGDSLQCLEKLNKIPYVHFRVGYYCKVCRCHCNGHYEKTAALHVYKKHLSDEMHKCHYCDKEFKIKKSRRRHEVDIHIRPRKSAVTSVLVIGEDAPQDPCPVCGKMIRVKYMNNHIKDVHTEKAKLRRTCPTCGKDVGLRNYRTHVKNHNEEKKRKMCEICGLTFGIAGFTKHMKRHEKSLEDRKRTCPYCGVKVVGMTMHMRSHEGRKFTCEICNKKFINKHHLKTHMKGVHQNIRPFKCTVCGFEFTLKHHLNAHIKAKHENLDTESTTNIKETVPETTKTKKPTKRHKT